MWGPGRVRSAVPAQHAERVLEVAIPRRLSDGAIEAITSKRATSRRRSRWSTPSPWAARSPTSTRRTPPSRTRAAPYMVSIDGMWTDEVSDEDSIAWVRRRGRTSRNTARARCTSTSPAWAGRGASAGVEHRVRAQPAAPRGGEGGVRPDELLSGQQQHRAGLENAGAQARKAPPARIRIRRWPALGADLVGRSRTGTPARRRRRTGFRHSTAAHRTRPGDFVRRGRTVAGHRCVGIDHRHDPRFQRDLIADQAARIAAAVGALVVAADPLADVVEADLAEEGCPQLGLAADLRPLLVVERALLVEDLERNLIAPDITSNAARRTRAIVGSLKPSSRAVNSAKCPSTHRASGR